MADSREAWPLWKLLAVQLVAVLVLLCALLEVWARWLLPADRFVWPTAQVPGVGALFQPDSRVVATNGLDFTVEARSNEAGFLDRPLPPVAKPPGTCRIAILGDSFVEAAQVPIDDKVQVRLEAMLKAKGREVETMAFGFSGTGQLNQLGYYDTWAAPRRPDVIVAVFVSNDFMNNSPFLDALTTGMHPRHGPRVSARIEADGRAVLLPTDSDWARHRLPRPSDTRPWLHKWLTGKSRFYRWLYAKLALQWPAAAQVLGREPTASDQIETRLAALGTIDPARTAGLGDWRPRAAIVGRFAEADPLPPTFAEAVRLTGFAFDQLAGRAKATDARLVVLATHEVEGRLEERLRALLEPRGIPYLGQRAHIAARGGRISDAHWRHDGHWSRQGHLWAAEMLVDWIEANGACRSP